MRSGPVIIGYDGSPVAERALRDAAALLAPREAIVVVVWEAGTAYQVMELPAAAVPIPPAPIDIRTAVEIDQGMYEQAQRLAEQGASLARDAGLNAEPLVVADDVTIADTLVRLTRERDAQVVVVGAHGRRLLTEVLLGSTSQEVIRHAPCPVLVARGAAESSA